jgi:ABC-type transport system involved in multi-copper enzyme maturation permease subunit
MTKPLANWGLPLLAKELTEQAARKRTYIVRVLYAALLFFSAYVLFYNTLQFVRGSPTAALGRGREMFEVLMGLQFTGIYLFAPALTCGTITQEKERASLQLLFLTRLGPWTILFEKLLSRLIPLVGFLMLSLPLLAFAYTLGGISPAYLAGGVWMLFASVLQVATLGLACSAYYRTTAAAFVASYLFSAMMFFGPVLIWEIFDKHGYLPVEIRFPFFGAMLFFSGNVSMGVPTTPSLMLHVAHSVPLLFSSMIFLLSARLFVVRRAFAPPRNIILNLFGRLDRLFHRWNENRWTKGIVLIADTGSLPDDAPIAWRETTKRSLGRARYLVRLFLVLEVPLLVLCLCLVTVAVSGGGDEFVSGVIFVLWGISVLSVSVQAASLIAGEKSHQTLDVLCTTPLTSRDIIRQKFRGVARLIAVLLVPFFTIVCFQCWVKSVNSGFRYYSYGRDYSPTLYLISSMLTACTYLPMVAWMSLWIGLNAKSQGRAIIGSLAAIVGWCIMPMLCCVMPLAFGARGEEGVLLLAHASPLFQILVNEFGNPSPHYQQPAPLILNTVVYGAALLIFRHVCLGNAARLLGRSEVANEPPYRRWTPETGPKLKIENRGSERIGIEDG